MWQTVKRVSTSYEDMTFVEGGRYCNGYFMLHADMMTKTLMYGNNWLHAETVMKMFTCEKGDETVTACRS